NGCGIAIDFDLLAVSGGWNPVLHLFAQAQGRLRFDENLAAFVPAGEAPGVECVGAARGSFALSRSLAEGAAAGARAAALCGFGRGETRSPPSVSDEESTRGRLSLLPLSRDGRGALADLPKDVNAADTAQA